MPLDEKEVGALFDLIGKRDNIRIIDGSTRVVLEGAGFLLGTQIIASLRAGHSVIINNAETLSHVIRDLRCEIEWATRHPVEDCTMFVTPAERAPLRPHVDAEHIITVQISGAKQWTLAKRMPVRSTAQVRLAQEDRRTVTVSAGDIFYLPPGVPHVVRTLSTPSISLAFGIERISAETVLQNALDTHIAAQIPEDFGFDWFDRGHDMRALVAEAFSGAALDAALSIARGSAVRRMANGSSVAGPWSQRVGQDGWLERTSVPMHVYVESDDAIVSIAGCPLKRYPLSSTATIQWIARRDEPFRIQDLSAIEGDPGAFAIIEYFVDCGALRPIVP